MNQTAMDHWVDVRGNLSPVHGERIWRQWVHGSSRAERHSEEAIARAKRTAAQTHLDGTMGEYGFPADQLHIEPEGTTRQGRLSRVRYKMRPEVPGGSPTHNGCTAPSPGAAGARHAAFWQNAADPMATAGSAVEERGFRSAALLMRPRDRMTRGHRAFLSAAPIDASAKRTGHRTRRRRSTRSISPRRSVSPRPHGLSRDTALQDIEPEREEQVVRYLEVVVLSRFLSASLTWQASLSQRRLYRSAHRARRDDPEGLGAPPEHGEAMWYYSNTANKNMQAGRRKHTSLTNLLI